MKKSFFDRLIKYDICSVIPKLFKLMPFWIRKWYIIVILMTAISALFEMIGITSILPVLFLITNPDSLLDSKYGNAIIRIIGNHDQSSLIKIAVSVFVMGNLIRIMLGVWVIWIQSTFSEKLIGWLSSYMFRGYMEESYSYHLLHDSSLLLRNITTEVYIVTAAVKYTIDVFGEMVVVFGIGLLLFSVDSLSFIVVTIILLIFVYVYQAMTGKRISYWGKKREENEHLRFKHVQEAFGGIKEVKLLHLENYKTKEYSPYNKITAKANQRYSFMQLVPRLWLELLLVIVIGSYFITNFILGTPKGLFVPVLGLYGTAAFRLMPSINRVLGAIQGIRFGKSAIENISNEIERFYYRADNNKKMLNRYDRVSYENDIELKDIVYTYSGANVPSIVNMNMIIQKNQTIGIIGGSGAGKSTLIDLILGIIEPDSGGIYVDGKNIKKSLLGWQHLLGYVPQTIYLSDSSLKHNIAFGIPDIEIDDRAIERVLRLAQLEDFVNGLPLGLETTVGERGVRLSGGQRQRIGIARALYRDPSILLLDEATSALDMETEEALMSAVNKLHGKKTVIIVAHRLTTVSKCDIIYKIEKGNIVKYGSPSEVMGVKYNYDGV